MKPQLDKKSFLVVDDYGDMRSMLRSMLHAYGVSRIDMAANGKEAVDALEENRYDVVLCDYNLGPGKDGQQVLEEARHRKLISLSTLFVIITAENTRDMVMGAIEYEPDSYLAKPFTKDLLRSRLQKLLIKKQDLEAVDRALERNDNARAIMLLDQQMADNPKNLAELTRLKADLCLRSGAYGIAMAIYQQVLAVREIPWARLGLGKVHYSLKQYAEALKTFQQLANEFTSMTAAYDWIARTHKAQGSTQEAQSVLENAVRLSPKSILRQQELGDIALHNKDFKAAEKAFQRVISIGKHSVYRHPSQYARLVESKISSEDKQDRLSALTVIQQMEKEFGGNDEAAIYAAMADAAAQQRLDNPDAAQASLNRAQELYQSTDTSSNSTLTLDMAKTSARLGDKETADGLFRKVVRNNHTNDELIREVETAFVSEGLTDSPTEMIAAIKQEIVDLNNRGVKLAGQGQIEEAVALFEEAAQNMNGNPTINLNAAKVRLMLMEKQGADKHAIDRTRKLLDRARKLSPNDPGLAKTMMRFKKLLAEVTL
jgi:tetratricopeptide (TPR) repeat protein